MFDTIKNAMNYIRSEQVAMIDLKFISLYGAWHHLTVPASAMNEETFTRGVGFDGSSVPGYGRLESGDMVIIPVPETGFIDPFWDLKTLSFICDIAEADTREPFIRDPRHIARKATQYLKDTGIATDSFWGPEFEYYIFDHVSHANDIHHSFYEIDSEEADWNTARRDRQNLGQYIPLQGGYHAIPPADKLYNLRSEATKLVQQCGIEVQYHHHEVGGPGQSEIEVTMGPLLQRADNIMLIKYFVKMVADKHNKTATFMPKPLHNEAGNGMHFHQNIMNGGKPLFHDPKGYAGLSKTALSYIAGLLKHAPALVALTNPSTNSFKRLIPGYEAPVNCFFSLANRTAAIRIPKYANKPKEKRLEFRPPDATCNPYLAMAAMLMAGIDGIKNNLDPKTEGFGPIDENIFTWSEEERQKKIKPIPSSLKSALEQLTADHAFLIEGDVFPREVIEIWIEHKMQNDYLAVRNRTHPYEVSLYYNC